MQPHCRRLLLVSLVLSLLALSPSPRALALAQRCAGQIGDYCGNEGSSTCCPTGAYCQPWNPGYYQCIAVPDGCSDMETDVDYYGNDLARIVGIQPWDCCRECQQRPDCQAFTFRNQAGPACYLKSSAAGRIRSPGAVSGRKRQCPTKPGQQCGSAAAGAGCCAAGSYCQPWDSQFYQCVDVPPGCGAMEPDVDYYGEDLKSLRGGYPWDCCAACQSDPECRYFTFINVSPFSDVPMCYLKRGGSGRRRLVGAVSGKRLTEPTCRPVGAPCGPDACCQGDAFCQPSASSQSAACAATPGGCTRMETDVDLYGNDLAQYAGVSLGDCCALCQWIDACRFFTHRASTPNGPTCFLKSSDSGRTRAVGVVSGKRLALPPPPTRPPTPPPTTATPAPPGRCPRQLKQIYFHGFDLANATVATPAECCVLCAATSRCTLFTHAVSRSAGTQRCLLKSQAGEKTNYGDSRDLTVVSGFLDP
ncbi:hypothetical protein ATCC90586_009382 [Pythium insidiosum]|nr:hypothetical protein ATCC90586_009382 [Pythium insidiosum]